MGHLFVCSRCNHVDDAELACAGPLPSDAAQQLCSKCKCGVWHDLFDYLPYDPAVDTVVNRPSGVALE